MSYQIATPPGEKCGLPAFLTRVTEEELLTLKEMIEAGKIQAAVDKVYSFEQVAEAHRRVETEQRLGTVILRPRSTADPVLM